MASNIVELSCGAETHAPFRYRHAMSLGRAGNDLLAEIVQIVLEIADILELVEFTSIHRLEPDAGGLPQSGQFRGVLGLSLLDQTQPFAQHLARVLVTARVD
jgi:hypothetical protein